MPFSASIGVYRLSSEIDVQGESGIFGQAEKVRDWRFRFLKTVTTGAVIRAGRVV